jgi:NAD(P)-dependent dehydrogenase (short-subunit alcohol dehydrogenase family)
VSKLPDHVALVTGASSGIGADTARLLAARGAAVTIMARRRDRLDVLAGELRRAGGRVHVVCGDVTTDADVERAVGETVAVFGRLSVVVCNAGVGYHGSLADTTPEAMARLLDVNFMGTFLVARTALPHLLREPDGRLIVVSSIVGKRGIAWGGAYSASKFAQVGLAEALRAELAGTPVRVCVVLPISTETEFRAAMAREQGFEVSGHGPRQSSQRVAAAIVRAIARPRAEVYPYAPSRLLTLLNALAPGLTDRVIRRFGRQPVPAAPQRAVDHGRA